MQADVLIITAAKDEDDAIEDVTDCISTPWAKCTDAPEGYLLRLREATISRSNEKRPIRVVIAPTADQREAPAAFVAGALVPHFKPFCLAMCGVCAGRPGEVSLGDVVIADKVWKYDAGGQIRLSGALEAEHHPEIETYQLPRHWKQEAERFKLALPAWNADSWGSRPEPSNGKPWTVHVGGIATGKDLMRDVTIWDRIAKLQNRKVLAIDMEGSAIGYAAGAFDVRRQIVVKGVMDYADPSKTDKCRRFAARAAAEVLIQFLRSNLDESVQLVVALEPPSVGSSFEPFHSRGLGDNADWALAFRILNSGTQTVSIHRAVYFLDSKNPVPLLPDAKRSQRHPVGFEVKFGEQWKFLRCVLQPGEQTMSYVPLAKMASPANFPQGARGRLLLEYSVDGQMAEHQAFL
jgi:nucleoside phosphorylase